MLFATLRHWVKTDATELNVSILSMMVWGTLSSIGLMPILCLWGSFKLINKFAQSNLGRGPRRGAVAHVRRKVPFGYKGMPQIHPKSTPSRGPIPELHYLPHPQNRLTYDAKRHPDPFPHLFTMHKKAPDWPMHVRTDRQIIHRKVSRL